MDRRRFLLNLGAAAVAPMLPLPALAAAIPQAAPVVAAPKVEYPLIIISLTSPRRVEGPSISAAEIAKLRAHVAEAALDPDYAYIPIHVEPRWHYAFDSRTVLYMEAGMPLTTFKVGDVVAADLNGRVIPWIPSLHPIGVVVST